MKIIPYMSYWRHTNKRPEDSVIKMHKISADLAKKVFGEINFIVDEKSLQYFEHIDWNTISIEFNDLPLEYSSVWSISKLYAYKSIAQKNKPFIHLDYDVFLRKKLPERVVKADVFVQSFEECKNFSYCLEEFYSECFYKYLAENIKVDFASNVGIFGGKNLDFIYKYADSAIELILDPQNRNFWIDYQSYCFKSFTKATLAEQYYLNVCAKYYDIKIEPLFIGNPYYEIAKKFGYTHLMDAKKDKRFKEDIESTLKKIIY